MERGLRRGTEDTVRLLARVLQLDEESLVQTWLYVSDEVTAAILESNMTDEAKRTMLRLYDKLRPAAASSGRARGPGASSG